MTAGTPPRVLRDDLLAGILLFFIAAWLFRSHLGGALTFLGNPDRLNTSLKLLKYYVDSLASGGLHAWNDAEMLGYDAFVQPYTSPNPFTFLVALAGPENVYISAGIVSFFLLGLAGLAAYAFIRHLTADRVVALVAAILYQCSAISILKVSQNDMSYVVLVLLPLMALLIRRSGPDNFASSYFFLSVLVFFLLQFSFLQKAAYALLFAGTYSIYRAWSIRSWKVFAIFCAAATTGIMGAAPRLYGVGSAVLDYVRVQPELKIVTFSDLFRYQGIRSYQFYRWFEDGIFGKYFTDTTSLVNGLNLSEGFLLYTSAMLPAVVIGAMAQRRGAWGGSLFGTLNEQRFFLWIMVFTFAAALSKPINYLLHILFLKTDFVHARILVVGLLAMVAYLALYLSRLRPMDQRTGWPVWTASVLLATLLIGAIEIAAGSVSGHWRPDKYLKVSLDNSATMRAALSVVAAIALLLVTRWSRARIAAPVAYTTLCVALALQAIVGADFRLNGIHTRGDVPFLKGDIYWADRSDFRPPSNEQRRALHDRIERDRYRSIVTCDVASAGGFCAGHVGEFWQLRLADGYYGIGVPARLAMLPWPNGLGLRHIRFTSEDNLPWLLLGLLNVKYALVNDNFLYRNQGAGEDFASLEVLTNPARVVPRVFFAAHAIPARSAQHAKTLLFKEGEIPDVQETTVVEGFSDSQRFSTKGAIHHTGHGDQFNVVVEPSPDSRFLVLNELYTPRWNVTVDGRPADLYPVNVVMRGVVVPAGARKIEFTYTPIVRTAAASICMVFAALLLIVGTALLARRPSAND